MLAIEIHVNSYENNETSTPRAVDEKSRHRGSQNNGLIQTILNFFKTWVATTQEYNHHSNGF